MLPAKKGTCSECAVEHPATQPHDKQSIFYQYKFYNEHGRWPTWKDAMSHCTEDVKELWIDTLESVGVSIE